MTSFQVTHNWTPQLIAKDRELKEKYGSAAHVTPMSSYAGLKRTPETEIMSFGKSNAEKTNSVSKKNLLIGAGLLLTVATGIAAYILTKGKKKPAINIGGKTDTILTNLQQSAGNNTTNKLENIVNEFKKYNQDFADLDPIVTKLKNGKQKLEFKYVDNLGFNHNQMLILDKSGNFEKMLVFKKGNGTSSYSVLDSMNSEARWSKTMKATTPKGNKRVINLEKPGGWQKEIVIKSNDKAACVANDDWHILVKGSQKKTLFTNIYKNTSGPADVRQYTYNMSGSGSVEQNRFAFKPGGPKVQIEDTFDGLSSEQIADMRELILGKRS